MKSGVSVTATAIVVGALTLLPLSAQADETPPPTDPLSVVLPPVPSTTAPPVTPTIPDGDFSLGPEDFPPAPLPPPEPVLPQAFIDPSVPAVVPVSPAAGGSTAGETTLPQSAPTVRTKTGTTKVRLI